METLKIIYTSAFIIGGLIPFLGLVLPFIENIFDFDFDSDSSSSISGLFSFNPMAFFVSLFVFGCTGNIVLAPDQSIFFSLTISICLSIVFYFSIMKFLILPLKNNNLNATNTSELVGKEATVISKINKQNVGEIQLVGKTGSLLTCFAVAVADEQFNKNDIVIIKEFKTDASGYIYSIVVAK